MSKLTVHAVPVAQPRQRHAVVGGHIRNYTPKTHPVNAYKAAVMAAAAEAGITPIDGPVAVDVLFYLPRPKRLMRKKDPDGPVPHTAKPDVDNLWKSTADALSGLAWRDDSQVCRTRAAKFYAEKDGTPRVEIVIAAMEELFDENQGRDVQERRQSRDEVAVWGRPGIGRFGSSASRH